jgi:hypothetical protein
MHHVDLSGEAQGRSMDINRNYASDLRKNLTAVAQIARFTPRLVFAIARDVPKIGICRSLHLTRAISFSAAMFLIVTTPFEMLMTLRNSAKTRQT